MDFRSDNVAGAAPEIMDALAAANTGTQSSYGADEWSAELDGAFSVLFDRECKVFPVATGTAAKTRVLITSTDGKREWGTVGVSENSIEASLQALVDSMDYALLKK